MKPHSSVRTLVLGVMISGQVTVAVAAAAPVAPVKQDENLISALNWMVS